MYNSILSALLLEMQLFLQSGPDEYVPSNSYSLYGRIITLLAQQDSRISSIFYEYDGLLNYFMRKIEFKDCEDFLRKARMFLYEKGLYMTKSNSENPNKVYTALETEFKIRLIEQGLNPNLSEQPQYQKILVDQYWKLMGMKSKEMYSKS